VVTARLTSAPSWARRVTSVLLQEPGPNGPESATGSPMAGALVEVMPSSSQPVLATGCTE
jgi:hypothetical protein